MAHWVSSNHNHADEYMGSSLPFCTGSISVASNTAQQIKFPYVTRWVQVFNNHASKGVRVGFTENGVEGNSTLNGTDNYFVVPAGAASARLEVKCISIWVAGHDNASTCSVVAGYTNIPENRFLNLTGSEGFEGVG
jgi:hypothetical protein